MSAALTPERLEAETLVRSSLVPLSVAGIAVICWRCGSAVKVHEGERAALNLTWIATERGVSGVHMLAYCEPCQAEMNGTVGRDLPILDTAATWRSR